MGENNGRVAGPRCIAIVGPFSSGKTTLLEAILARAGAVPRQGSVPEGTTVGDSSPEARSHQMSVEVNIAQAEYMGDTYSFVDCPGSVELLSEAEGVLAASDCAIVVCEADEKKVPALQVILKSLEDRGIPRLLFLNKIDKGDKRVRETLEMMQPASSVPLVLRQIPIWKDGIATGFMDLALERGYIYQEHAASQVIDIADAERAREVEARFSMLEKLADYDDELMEQLLDDIEPERDRVFEDLIKDFRDGQICPVFIGSAEHGNGIQRLMKALRHETPSIDDTRKRLGQAIGDDAVVQVLKTIHTAHGGKMSISRVVNGTIGDGDIVFDSRGNDDRVSSVFDITGQHATKRGRAGIGETVALGKVDNARTGDTLTTVKGGMPALVELDVPQPVLAQAVAPTERKDEVKLSSALQKILEEDPSLRVAHIQETGETLLEGQGEMHLRVALERLTSKYGISVDTHHPTIPYKESIRGSTTVRGRHKKQSGGHGQFGDVVLDIKPLPRSSGFEFSNTISGGVVPKQYIPSVEHGVQEYLSRGPLGFPVVDLAVILTDGSYHSVDSSDQAFKTAAHIGMREGMPDCKPVLLEPVLEIEVACPNESTARINAIISGRRGQLLGFDARPGWSGWDVVKAQMPQSEIQDLIIELRSATAGVAALTQKFDHLSELTGRLADDVMKRYSSAAA
jgi:elongation factor G